MTKLTRNLTRNHYSLTGDGLGGKYYYTTVSNTMRVSWQPNGGVGVRGLMVCE